MSTITELKWTSLTPLVNEIKSPNQFLKRRLYGRHVTLPTEDIELSVLTKGREVAPFVRKNGAALLIDGHSETFQTVSAPNIRVKRPFTPSGLLFNRRPGTVIFSPGAGMQVSALQQHIARDMQVMADAITNAEEYLCALSLTGVVSYSVSPNEHFTITYPKPAANNVTLTTFWDDADPTLPDPEENFHLVKKLLSDAVGLGLKDAIMGAGAAAAFRKILKIQGNLGQGPKLDTGNLTLQQQYSNEGVIYLGQFCGVECWEYSRTVAVAGVSTPLIRDKFVEFVAEGAAAEFTLYYGAIPDMKALQGRKFQGERFSKSWENEDPSQMIALAHSRPLPVPRRPGAMVSMQVIA